MLDEKRDGNQDSSVPLTNLGRVIERRKKLNIPQEEVAKVCGLTKQRWNQIEKAYQNDPCADRVFSFGEMHKLNLLLSFDENEALSTKREPAVFSEREIIERSFYDAMERDSFLTSLVLRRICESSEEDLTLLQQTASVLVDGGIPYKYDSLLVFYAAMRKHIMRAICQIVPDEEALDSFVSSVKKTMEEESNSAGRGGYRCLLRSRLSRYEYHSGHRSGLRFPDSLGKVADHQIRSVALQDRSAHRNHSFRFSCHILPI